MSKARLATVMLSMINESGLRISNAMDRDSMMAAIFGGFGALINEAIDRGSPAQLQKLQQLLAATDEIESNQRSPASAVWGQVRGYVMAQVLA